MNNFNNWSNIPVAGAQNWYQSPYQNGPSTNVLKVTSLEEAIMQSNSRPSETVYFHQSKNEFYNVRVDVNGNKSWQTFTYNVAGAEIVPAGVISKEMYDLLEGRVSALEKAHVEVPTNEQSNG